MCVFCFVFLFFISILVAFLFRAKEKLCGLLAQARVPPSVLVPAVCAVDQNQKEALCCQSSGFLLWALWHLLFLLQSTPVWSRSSVGQDPIDVSGVGGGRKGVALWCTSAAEISSSDLWNRVCHFPPQGNAGTAPGTARTEPKALQNLGTPPLLLCLRFPTLLLPAGHELKSLKQRWLPRSTDCWCSHLSL